MIKGRTYNNRVTSIQEEEEENNDDDFHLPYCYGNDNTSLTAIIGHS